MTPDLRLLAALSCRTATAEIAQTIAALAPAFHEWSTLLERSRNHGTLPLVARNLQHLGLALPSVSGDQLRAEDAGNLARNLAWSHELRRLVESLERLGIASIPLKGVVLAEQLYGDIGSRMCRDLDLLIPRRAVPDALAVFAATGYGPHYPAWVVERFMIPKNIECRLSRIDGPMEYVLEPHWGVFLGGSASDLRASGEIWRTARRARWSGAELLTLSREWVFLVSAVHVARHEWPALKSLVDVHEASLQPGVDWKYVAEISSALGWTGFIEYVIGRCHALFNTPAPPGFSARLPPPWMPFDLDHQSASSPLYSLRLLARRSDRIRRTFTLAFRPTRADYELIRLPRMLSALYVPVHFCRQVLTRGWKLLRPSS